MIEAMSGGDLTASTVAQLATLLAEGSVSAPEVLEAHLAVIRADGPPSFDGRPDAVNAFVRLYEEEAVAAAEAAERRLRDGSDVPPLCGIPIGLKDLYAVAGKFLTASSHAVVLRPEADSDVWVRLRDAGAVLVGHLHTHECAAGGSTDQVGNPHALDRTAGGSSGGSAAALAAGMVPLATGSDTAGSLRIPSAISGTSAIKPTRGALPLRGVFPLSGSLDHPGPMARTLGDSRSHSRSSRARAGRARRCAAPGSRPRRGWRSWSRTPTCSRATSGPSTPAARSAPSWSSRPRRPLAWSSAATSSTC
jgi:aspartyl-tRNA(Asn)/glutamyl-tRNA(Gln) amidotransferase subunit A